MGEARNNAEQTLAQAMELYQGGDAKAARRSCERILAARPDHGPARHLLALSWAASGDIEAATGNLERLLTSEPDNGEAHHNMGRLLAGAGRLADAEAHLERAIEIAPGDIASYLALAEVQAAAEKPGEAAATLRRGLAIAPDDFGLLNNLGGLLAQQGDGKEGAELLKRALARQPDSAVTHFNYAMALKGLDRPEQAVEHYRKAIALQPDLHNAWSNLGNLLLDLGRVDEAAEAYMASTEIRRRPGGPRVPPQQYDRTSRSKLQHDIEQLECLIERGCLPAASRQTVTDYRAALAALPAAAKPTEAVELPADHAARLAPTYNRLIHLAEAPALAGPAVAPTLDTAAIEADYFRNAPGYTSFDGFLVPEALDGLRRFCLESTIWYEFLYEHGYLGAFMNDGFFCPLLLQVAEELRRALPGIFGAHTLRKLWAFKYDSKLSGIPIHADFAAVNVNFWITPDAANRDPDSGGLVFWDKEAPPDWDFGRYNADEPAMRDFLEQSGAKSVNVPHRQNRVVVFNSDLFHETGAIDFRDGYENRRINITMLYGKRGE